MHRLTRYAVLLAVPALAALIGCTTGSTSTTAPASPLGVDGPVSVTKADIDQLEAAVEKQKGKVVLIDFWATWCPPCVRSFPDFVKTHGKYQDKGLFCISVSLDEGEGSTRKEKVLAFLKKHDAVFPNYILTGNPGAKLQTQFGFANSIPHTVLFGKSGNKVWSGNPLSLGEKGMHKKVEAELAK